MKNDTVVPVPAQDLATQYVSLKPEIDAAVARVLASGRYIGGPEVVQFENEFARFCGTAHAVAVGNGTDALRFALIALGVGGRRAAAERGGPGTSEAEEVVTSPLTFAATTEAASQAGARPVFVDIDPATFNLDPSLVERALTKRTRAILPVHLYGQPAEMDPILALAARRGIVVVEDACQAHGALYKERPAGSLGDAGCFSFYPTKNLGAFGEGGMVTTSSADVAKRIRGLRDHGQTDKYVHVEEGYTGRLDAIQAAILSVKLKHLQAWNERRRALANRYRAGLEGSAATLPTETPLTRHVYHLFAVRVPDRDAVRAALMKRGIETGVHYPVPLHLQPAYSWMGLGRGSFPEAERAAREVLTLPLFPQMTDAQVDRVCAAVREVLGAG